MVDAAEAKAARIRWLAQEIAEAAAHTNASEHWLLTRLREHMALGGWEGAVSPAHWLSWWTKISLVTARAKVAVARKLDQFQKLDAAFERSELSYTQVRAIARVISTETEEKLLDLARHATGDQLEKICSAYRRSKAALEAPGTSEEEEDKRCIRRHETDDGRVKLTIQGLDPDEAATVQRALEAALAQIRRGTKATRGAAHDSAGTRTGPTHDSAGTRTGPIRDSEGTRTGPTHDSEGTRTVVADPAGPGTSPVVADDSEGSSDEPEARSPEEVAASTAAPSERHPAAARVDALIAVCEAFLAAIPAGRVRSRTELIVSVDRTALLDAVNGVGQLRDGSVVSPATLRRLACDAAVVDLVRGPEGQTVDVGRARRTIPAPILRALEDRDGGCIFPGCRNDRWVDGHHVKHWGDGGSTKLENLCLLCRLHHGLVHEGKFTVTPQGGRFLFHDRWGRLVVERPQLRDLGPDRLAAIRAKAPPDLMQTAFATRWNGTPCDYGIAVEGLCDAVGLRG